MGEWNIRNTSMSRESKTLGRKNLTPVVSKNYSALQNDFLLFRGLFIFYSLVLFKNGLSTVIEF